MSIMMIIASLKATVNAKAAPNKIVFKDGTTAPYALIFSTWSTSINMSLCQTEYNMLYEILYSTYIASVLVETNITYNTLVNIDSSIANDTTVSDVKDILEGTSNETSITTNLTIPSAIVTPVTVNNTLVIEVVTSRRRQLVSSKSVTTNKNNLRYQTPKRKLQTLCRLIYCRRANFYIMDILECEEFCGFPPDRRLEHEMKQKTQDEVEIEEYKNRRELQQSLPPSNSWRGRPRTLGFKFWLLSGRGMEIAKLFYDSVDKYIVTSSQCKNMLNMLTYEIVDLILT